MLKNIHPLLSGELLNVLRTMGHGDDIALVDRNFPATSLANGRPVIRLDGNSVSEAAEAILSVLPLDSFVDHPVRRMEVVGEDPATLPEVQQEFSALLHSVDSDRAAMGSLERFAFYEATRQAFAVVVTGEARGYGCFLLKKGVIFS
ncbi:RbsD/FucU family protein [Larsenimonas rhizosphaerae]|uniref:Fucose-binding protein n=1 Tax=Larsenimonas rhizosphaerae TaxID=2944682 RepID=A0AA41ZLG7_9GAMM|nr:RbsD/FucU domain-containing protein [Larsenimonas rhizosphaerae]MCM2129618.1 fucose-binding protein [Larsenimonas rhizosphaerae]MCX2524276.1 fucose-binding protein [Larsenimonas rhizosphaerae]